MTRLKCIRFLSSVYHFMLTHTVTHTLTPPCTQQTNRGTRGFLHWNLRRCPTACKQNAYLAVSTRLLTPEVRSYRLGPLPQQHIDKLEQIQQNATDFIAKDYRSKKEKRKKALWWDSSTSMISQLSRSSMNNCIASSCTKWLMGWCHCQLMYFWLPRNKDARPDAADQHTLCPETQ